MSSVFFLVVEPSKIIFLIKNTIPQKEDIILLYIGYHSIPKLNTTHMWFWWLFCRVRGVAVRAEELLRRMGNTGKMWQTYHLPHLNLP